MGYTRYWKRTDEEIDQGVVDMAKDIIDMAEKDYGIKVGDAMGNGEPIIDAEHIVFNGDATKQEDYETFYVGPETGFEFCKTARQPYDIVVNAMLKMLKEQGIVKDVSSDGDNCEHEAKELLDRALEV